MMESDGDLYIAYIYAHTPCSQISGYKFSFLTYC